MYSTGPRKIDSSQIECYHQRYALAIISDELTVSYSCADEPSAGSLHVVSSSGKTEKTPVRRKASCTQQKHQSISECVEWLSHLAKNRSPGHDNFEFLSVWEDTAQSSLIILIENVCAKKWWVSELPWFWRERSLEILGSQECLIQTYFLFLGYLWLPPTHHDSWLIWRSLVFFCPNPHLVFLKFCCMSSRLREW